MGLELGLFRSYVTHIGSTGSDFISNHSKMISPQIKVQPFPLPPHKEYEHEDSISSGGMTAIVPHSVVLGFTFVVFSLVQAPVVDKESGFKVRIKHYITIYLVTRNRWYECGM